MMTDRAKSPIDDPTDRCHLPRASVCALCLLLLMTSFKCAALEVQAAQGAPLRPHSGKSIALSAIGEQAGADRQKQTWLVLRIVQQRWYHKVAFFFRRTRDVQIDRTLPVEGFEVVRMTCHALVGAGGKDVSKQIRKNLANCHRQAHVSCRKKELPQVGQYTYEVDERFVHRLRRWKIKRQVSGAYEVWEEPFFENADFFYFCQKKSDLESKNDDCLGGSGIKFQPALQHQYLKVSTGDLMVAAVSNAFNSSATSYNDVSLSLEATAEGQGFKTLTVRAAENKMKDPLVQTVAQVEPSNVVLPRLEGWPGDEQIRREGTEISIRGPFLSDFKAFAPPEKIEEATDIIFIKIKERKRRGLDRMKKRRLSKTRRIITLLCYSGRDKERLRSCIDKLGDDMWADEIFLASAEYDFLAAHMDSFLSPFKDNKQADQYKYVIHDLTGSKNAAALHAPLAPSLWPSYREQTAKKMYVKLHFDEQKSEIFKCNKLTLRFNRSGWSIEALEGENKKQLPNVGNRVLVRFHQVDPIIRYDDKEEARMMVPANDVDYLELKRLPTERSRHVDYRRATNVIIGGCDALSSINITAEAFNLLQVWIVRDLSLRLRSTKIFDDPAESGLLGNGVASAYEETSL